MFWISLVAFNVGKTLTCVAFKFSMVLSNFFVAHATLRLGNRFSGLTVNAFLWKFFSEDFVVRCHISEIAFDMNLAVT